MILIVAEKPSVGRDIARVLKCSHKADGYIAGDDYIITWAFGHLVALVDPDEIDEKLKKWRMEDLPIMPEVIPTKIIAKSKNQFSVIKKLMLDSKIKRIICATDAGREGELIFGLIYEKSGSKKPVDRLWISSMTDAAIKEGFENLKPMSHYAGLYQSALCRSQADWLVGMNASRAFTLGYDALLSVGRVQTPTLAILVKRQNEISEFKPEEYYTLTADFGDYQGQWFDPGVKEDKLSGRIKDKETAAAKAKKIRGKQARVSNIQVEEKRELPPQLYDLTSLQRDANRMLGFTADKTLKTAQSLYETKKAITYPRTDSRYLPHDMLSRVYKTMENLTPPYQDMLKFIEKKDNKLPYSKRVFDDSKVSDHHAIIPTPQKTSTQKLSPDERALFDLVSKRFIAAFCSTHQYLSTRIETLAEEEHFKSLGKTVLVQGWKNIYQSTVKESEAKTKDKEAAVLPKLSIGEQRTVEKAASKKESTKPPAPHTDASLLSSMENAGREIDDEALRDSMRGSGLGTPATRAAIIERLIKVGYAQRKGKAIAATQKGENLIQVVPSEIASPEITGKWELALNEIAQQKRDAQRFMEGIRRLSSFLVHYAKDEKKPVVFEKEFRGRGGKLRQTIKTLPEAVCPLCGKPVQENDKAFGCTDWKSGCSFTLWKDSLARRGGPRLNAATVTKLLKNKQVQGSIGTIILENDTMSFTKKGDDHPTIRQSIRYQKANTAKK